MGTLTWTPVNTMKTRLASLNLVDRALQSLTDDELNQLIDAMPEEAREPYAEVIGEAGAIDRAAGTRLAASRGRVNGTLDQIAFVLSERCLDECIQKLGDSSENPTEDELRTASYELVETHGVGAVRLMLAAALLGEAQAGPVCIRLLKHDDALRLPPQPESQRAAASVVADDDPEREALRERRKDDRRRKQTEAQARREQAKQARHR